MAYEQYVELETSSFEGVNTANQFNLIPRSQSPRMQNAYMDEIGDISKRPGTIPVTASPVGSPIKHLTTYKSSPSPSSAPEIYAAAGTTLYKYDGNETLNGLTMTNALNSSDIFTVAFTDKNLVSIMVIGDGKELKQCNGTEVKNVTPASNDPSPAPQNVLTNINAKGHKFVWEYSGHIFSSPGTNELFYSKRYTYDYWPETQYFQIIGENDFINGCGVAFDTVCLIPMRRRWAILTGENFDNFDASKFLNTTRGVVAPRTIAKITYPNGEQTVAFLSDDEMHEVYLAIIDGGGRVYATRSIMQDRVDFAKLGLTEAEKAAAVGFFDAENGRYFLSFRKGTTDYTWVYDTRNKQWYPDWTGFNARSYVSVNDTTYFAGDLGHLCKFDKNLYSDWKDKNKTTGTPVHFKRYSPALSFEFSGYDSFWDAYLVESKQWTTKAGLDIVFVFSESTKHLEEATANESFIWGASRWGYAKFVNVDFTDILNEPNEIFFDFSVLSRYCQVVWENNRDEPVKIYKDKFKGRVSGR